MLRYLPNLFAFVVVSFLLGKDCIGQKQVNHLKEDTFSIKQSPPLNITFQQLGDEELPKYIANVVKDKKGFLWMATKGVVQFDGMNSRIYKNNPLDTNGLSNSIIRSVFLDQSDTPWVITVDFVLHRFDSQLKTFRKIPLIFSDTKDATPIRPTFLLEDSHGVFWLATATHGLFRLNPQTGQLTKVSFKTHSLAKDVTFILSLLEDEQGNIWGTGEQLFSIHFQEKNRQIQQIKAYPEIGSTVIKSVAEDTKGNIWVAVANESIVCLQPENRRIKKFIYAPNAEMNQQEALEMFINTIFIDINEHIWVATPSDGIKILNPISGQFITFNHNENEPASLRENFATSVYGDQTGVVWVTTWGGGINQYTPNLTKFGHFQSISVDTHTLSNNAVRTFYEAADETIWVGVEGGLNKFNAQTRSFQRYLLPDTFDFSRPDLFLSIVDNQLDLPNFKDKLLIGSYNGLLTFDPVLEKYAKWKAPNEALLPIETSGILAVTKDAKGMLWVLTFLPAGIFKFEESIGTFSPVALIHQQDTIKNVENIIADQQQRYWIGTKDRGLYQLDLNTQEFSHFNIQSDSGGTFPATRIRSCWKDRQNRQWIGTELGLFLLIPSSKVANAYDFRQFTELDGLPSSTISGLLEDEQGFIWASTPNGLSKLDTETMIFKNYKKSDGLQDNYFNYYAVYKSPTTKELFFGGNNGFNVFDPNTIKKDTFLPGVAITEIAVYRKGNLEEMRPTKITKKEPIPSIALFYEDRLVQINYTGLYYTAPTQNQFAVQLVGYDTEWRYVRNQRQVTYTNLDAGNYEFRVKSANKDDVWNEKGATLNIVVHPPWWATWWAYSTYAILSLASIYALYLFQLRRNQEKAEAKQLKEIDALKTVMLKEIHHRVKNNLQIISNLMAKQARKTSNDTVKKMMKEGQDRVQSMALIHQNLYQSDSLSGIDIKVYLEELTQNIAHTQSDLGKKIAIQLDIDDSKLDIDTAIPVGLILNELITNCYKYAFPERNTGKISICFKKRADKKFSLEVKDNGVGIANDLDYRRSKSLGLNLVQGLVEQLDGTMNLIGSNQGTQFELVF